MSSGNKNMGFNLFFYVIVFLFGLTVGSFLNCVIYRLGTGESFLKGRSHCPHCKHTLSWQDLIPIFSFLILKGKCRYCHQKISIQYPLIELATAILFTLIIHYTFPNFLLSTFYLLLSSFLIVIFVYDLKHYIIPDKVIYPAIAIALIFNFKFLIFNQFSPKESLWLPTGQAIFKYAILSAVLAAAFFLFIFLISRGKWLGFGDVKLGFLMGLFLSFPKILVSLFFAYLIGAIIGIGLILAKKKTLKSEVPFGPFLVTGTFIALFWGNQLINWYLNFFRI
jgi:prepilin signal peptidase PulO-like enzyme (type II secretory pathway)